MTAVRYVVDMPTVKGPDPLHIHKRTADREAAAAQRAGHAATVREVLVRR